jgi:O-antigen ligase
MGGRVAQVLCVGLPGVGLAFAVDARVVGAWELCLLILSLTALGYWLITARSVSVPPLEQWLGAALLFVPAYVALQLVPLPLFLLRILSPARAQLAESLGSVMVAPRFAAISVSPSTTSLYLIRIIGYAVVFLLVRELTWRLRGRWRWTLFVPLILIATAEATLGLSQIAPNSPAHGTYGNRNHFAGFLEMVLPGTAALGLAIRGFAGIGVLCLATLIFLGILYSLSKMGFVAALSGLFVMAALGVGARLPRRTRWLAVAGLVAIVLLALIFLPPDQVINGIGGVFADDATGEGRFPIWADSLHLIAAYPVFGVGLGNYVDAFLKYQTAAVDVVFNYAHNDYVELLAELGVFGFLSLAGFLFVIFRKAVRAATRHPDANIRYLGLGCVGGMAAIGLHSITDFNMYVPANAFVFAWIAGIAAGLPSARGRAVQPDVAGGQFPLKPIAVALSAVLAVYASAWFVFERSFANDPKAERLFCRFGICNTSAMLFGFPEDLPQADLLEALRRHPANPRRWSDLGEAMVASKQLEKAQLFFSNALALGPNRPDILSRTVDFYHRVGKDSLALEQTSRALAKTGDLDRYLFAWFKAEKIPLNEILSQGLPPDARVFRNYLRYMLNSKNSQAAEQVWSATLAHGYADDKLAREYVNFMASQNLFEPAARAWAAYLGDRRNGYLESNWLFNGDFESEVHPDFSLDWTAWGGGGVEVARDAEVRHSGAYSLRMRFEGKQNLTDAHVGQRAFVTPGRYRFEAYLKSQELTTDQGISLQIFDATGASHLNVKTEPLLGTHGWTKVDLNVCVPPPTKWIQVRVVRQPSLKFDNLIKGTLWLDSVNLMRVSQYCSVS